MNPPCILVLGAGRSSHALIHYLAGLAESAGWRLVVGDLALSAAQQQVGNSTVARAITFNLDNEQASRQEIGQASLVISLLPPHLHITVANICLQQRKHLFTASYVTNEMRALHTQAKDRDLLLLNECGLDPGIDHMSAMQVIDRIREGGGHLLSFESFTGGLIAPGTDPENPWRYKFTWNPRNVVMAGQGTARFLQEGKLKFIPYQQLFIRTTPITVPGVGELEGYANRDSLKYLETYGLNEIKTMLRGTLRYKGFCRAWNVLVQLGCCDDSFVMEHVDQLTHREFINSFLPNHPSWEVEEKLMNTFALKKEGEEMNRLRWSGFFSDEPVGIKSGTPSQILEHILNKKWKLNPGDKDYIVMWHRFVYEQEGKRKEIQAHLAVTGDDEVNTAMAKTVGLPLGIAARLFLEGKIKSRGVVIPVTKEFYEPILSELSALGIALTEREIHFR
jgi:saccharopine dehydrogenase-like NADP-dependent oxidoreductase